MQKFINSHPGCENDEELESLAEKLGPPQKKDPKLFGDVDMVGIPDQFTPGYWQEIIFIWLVRSKVLNQKLE